MLIFLENGDNNFIFYINFLAKCILFVILEKIFEKCLLFLLGDLDDWTAGLITVLLFLCSSVSPNFLSSTLGLSYGINSSLSDYFKGESSD